MRDLGLGDRVGDFLGHVGLVVLGQNLGRDELTVLQRPSGDDALTFTEQVRKNAGVFDRQLLEAVGDDEIDLERIVGAPDRFFQ